MSPEPHFSEIVDGKVLSWATDLDDNTMAQAHTAAAMPFVKPHVALMPDAHFGYGSTVGSVIPTQGAIIPSAIGVDIGCGMIATRTTLTASDLPDDLSKLHSLIAAAIPAGVGQGHSEDDPRMTAAMPHPDTEAWTDRIEKKVGTQFGSLGSGNHFVEVSLDENDSVWIVLHSGSRGPGNMLANWHIDGAKKLMKDYFITLDEPDLAYLVEGTPAFEAYIADMLWAQGFAYQSRELMMSRALIALDKVVGRFAGTLDDINCHHNFTQREHHMGKNVWLTRKGAIQARTGDMGVIPGSMGTSTFIVEGRGNIPSFQSCSHGAGRTMSRTKARKNLSLASLREKMDGVTWNDDDSLLDEHPDAYKDINQVMIDQADLVKIRHTLKQVLNYKGT